MPAGDLVVADWTLELRGVLMGVGTPYRLERTYAALEGLGPPPVKTADVPLHHADGAYGSSDLTDVRVITVPLTIRETTPGAALNALTTLSTVWAPSTNDIPLYMRVPGWGKFYVDGRPRDCVTDLSQVTFGYIHFLARFDALDPTINFVS